MRQVPPSADGLHPDGTPPTPAPAEAIPSRTAQGRTGSSHRAQRAALALLAVLPSACAVIGPTVRVAPGPGKSPDAFASDRRGCMAEVDRRLQPVADRINAPGTPPSTVAANNAGLQADYDRGFSGCMAARGNLPDPALVRSAAFPAPAAQASPATSDAAAILPGGWRLLRLSYHGTGRPKDVNDELWRREIANLPAGRGGQLPIYEVSFPDGNTTVLLSIAGQGEPACDNGPNDVDSTRDYAVCPGKLALLQDGRPVATRSTGRTCAEVINDGGVRPGAPGWQDPRLWGTRGRYAAASGTIELVTLQQGRPERACTKTLQVR